MTEHKPSKTALKRLQLELQALGERMLEIGEQDLGRLPIDDDLRDAVREAGRIRSHGALRRQKQLIGKMMRNVDPEPIRRALDALAANDIADKRRFADAERWRDRLVAEGVAAVAALEEMTGRALPDIVELVRELDGILSDKQEKTIRRRLFRAIHSALIGASRDDRLPR